MVSIAGDTLNMDVSTSNAFTSLAPLLSKRLLKTIITMVKKNTQPMLIKNGISYTPWAFIKAVYKGVSGNHPGKNLSNKIINATPPYDPCNCCFSRCTPPKKPYSFFPKGSIRNFALCSIITIRCCNF